VLDAPLHAGKPQEPKALHTGLGVAWVAPSPRPLTSSHPMYGSLAEYTMTPQAVGRRMAVLLYLAAVVVQLPLSCTRHVRWYRSKSC
jgi:hypothetical protein